MKTEDLARQITLALISQGHVHDSKFTAVSRMIKEALDKEGTGQ